MIRIDKGLVQIEGMALDCLAEAVLGVTSIIEALKKDGMPEDIAVQLTISGIAKLLNKGVDSHKDKSKDEPASVKSLMEQFKEEN